MSKHRPWLALGLLSILLSWSLLGATAAAASTTGATEEAQVEQATGVRAGILPDSPFYFLDRTLERVELMLSFGNAAKASFYTREAAERLAEAAALSDSSGSSSTTASSKNSSQQLMIKTLVEGSKDVLLAIQYTEEARAGGTSVSATAGLLAKTAKAGGTLTQSLAVNKVIKQITSDAMAQGLVTGQVITQLTPASVKKAHQQGVPFGRIAVALTLSKDSGKPLKQALQVFNTSANLASAAQRLNVSQGPVATSLQAIGMAGQASSSQGN